MWWVLVSPGLISEKCIVDVGGLSSKEIKPDIVRPGVFTLWIFLITGSTALPPNRDAWLAVVTIPSWVKYMDEIIIIVGAHLGTHRCSGR